MAGNCDDLVAKAKDAVELVLRIGYGIPAGRLGPVMLRRRKIATRTSLTVCVVSVDGFVSRGG